MFDALHILKPGWYFNHDAARKDWPDYDSMTDEEKRRISPDNGFRSSDGRQAEAAYRLLQVMVPENQVNPLKIKKIHPFDEYRFIARHFSKIWLPYYLVNRFLRFKNPVIELAGMFRALGVKRYRWNNLDISPDTTPSTQGDQPRVAVIIPTLNRHEYLEDALADLYAQDYPDLEIIVVDQSDVIPEGFMAKHQGRVTYIRQDEKALWLARNKAISMTSAEYLLFFDDDSRVDPDWISKHMNCLVRYDADISSGISLSRVGDRIPHNYRYFRLSDQLDTGNAMIRRSVFRKTGLFDRQFEKQRMGDGEFGLRAYLAGFVNVSNPEAKRIHLKVPSGGLRQHGHWDGWRSVSWSSPRPVPSVLYYIRRYWGSRVAVRYIAVHVIPSVLPYRFKGNKWKLLLYIPVLPFILIGLTGQVLRSWRLAGKMLETGPSIAYLSDKKDG